MKRSAFLLVAVSFILASTARADSTGVPYLDGSWQGKFKAKIFDQTIPGSNDPRFKYKSQIDVDIIQAEDSDDLIVSITFATALPVGEGTEETELTFTGAVGNFHMNIRGENDGVFMAGSGAIDKKAKQIRMNGTAASADYTIEFELKVKRLND